MTSESDLHLGIYLCCHIQVQKSFVKPGASPQKVSRGGRGFLWYFINYVAQAYCHAPALSACIDKVLQFKIQSLDPSDEQRCVLFRERP